MANVWLAALSGLIGGGALLLGAVVAWFVDIPQRVVAGIMALGSGVLISTLAFELVEEAAADGGLVATTVGFLAGAILYIVADWLVSRPKKEPAGAPAAAAAGSASAGSASAGPASAGSSAASSAGSSVERSASAGSAAARSATDPASAVTGSASAERSAPSVAGSASGPASAVADSASADSASGPASATGSARPSHTPAPSPSPSPSPANIVARRAAARLAGGTGAAIAIGALIDGIPESIVIGLSVLQGGISIPIVAAIAISNIPEGLGSTAALKRSGSSGRKIALLWSSIALVTVVAAVLGFVAFQAASPQLIALITTVAAGGLLAMVCNTMIPEAFAEERALTGLYATIGFLAAFLLHELA